MYDFAIIGSGVSGGRIAFELTTAGAKCVLLEAGREFSAKTFPRNELDYSTQLFWGGGLEVNTNGDLGFLRAKCLGGTSIVNQALLDRFDELAWSDWRTRSGVSDFTSSEYEKHYLAIESQTSIQSIPPERYGRNAKIFMKAFGAMDLIWKPLDRAQTDCALEHGSDCIVCLGGCPRDSKQSSLVTTIRNARKLGLEVRSEFEVDHVDHGPNEVKIRGKHKGSAQEVVARKVVLASGALGNTAILIRSGYKKSLPALGSGFCCHPQFMSYGLFKEPVDAHKGAFQSVKSADPKIRKAGYKFENVFAQPIGTAMLIPGFGKNLLRIMKKYRYLASMEVAIRDEPTGKIDVLKNGKLKIKKNLTSIDLGRIQEGLEMVRNLFHASEAQEVIQGVQGFGLHLMGGCPMGVDSKTSVVSPDFQIYGYPNLYAADSSIFPGAPGINPSFTIMALSHRAAQKILGQRR